MTVLLQHRGACALRAGEPWQRARRRHGEAFLLPWPLCWGAHWPHELGGPFPSSYLRWRWQRQPSRLSPPRKATHGGWHGFLGGQRGLPLCGRPGPEQCRSARVGAGLPTWE